MQVVTSLLTENITEAKPDAVKERRGDVGGSAPLLKVLFDLNGFAVSCGSSQRSLTSRAVGSLCEEPFDLPYR